MSVLKSQTKVSNPRIIVALDYAKREDALTLVNKLDPKLCRLKVGKEMFTHFGPDFVKQLIKMNFNVFLDLKFHDIPNTVAKACAAAADLGVWMTSVHTLGGRQMLEAAHQAVKNHNTLLVGITLLTSMQDQDAHEVGLIGDTKTIVARLAQLAFQTELNGVVCSAQEASDLRQRYGKDFFLVTPGIRLQTEEDASDQKRIMTPQSAFAAGADYLVIGRPITQASNPLQVLQQIYQEKV